MSFFIYGTNAYPADRAFHYLTHWGLKYMAVPFSMCMIAPSIWMAIINSIYCSWACRWNFSCLRLHLDDGYGSLQWKMTHFLSCALAFGTCGCCLTSDFSLPRHKRDTATTRYQTSLIWHVFKLLSKCACLVRAVWNRNIIPIYYLFHPPLHFRRKRRVAVLSWGTLSILLWSTAFLLFTVTFLFSGEDEYYVTLR